MSLSREQLDMLHHHASSVIDGSISSEEFAKLTKLLDASAESRSVYARYMYLQATLTRALGGLTRAAQDSKQQATIPQTSTQHPRAGSPVLGFLGRTREAFSKPVIWSILGAGLIFCGYIAAITWGLRRERAPNGTDSVDSVAATITNSADVVWSGSADKSEIRNQKPEVAPGEPLRIDSGLVELRLKQGAMLLVEGPASWSIDGDNRATLHAGKLVAKVPQEAIGFTVDTPTAKIVDLGTEFGIETDDRGATQLQVFKGKVQLHAGTKRGGSSPAQPPITLAAGEARRVESDSKSGGVIVREAAVTPNRFARSAAGAQVKQIRVEGAMASSTHPMLNVNDLINGNGLVEGRHSATWQNTMWHTAHDHVKQEFVLFDLFRPHRLNSMKVWNFNCELNGRAAWLGVKEADIYVSISGNGDPLTKPEAWRRVVAKQQFAPGTGRADYDTPTTVELQGAEARFVAIVIDDCWEHGPHPPDLSPDVVGLSEVQFFGSRVPNQTPKAD